ncbi:hypothetical protein BJ322DRAFT_863274 [Thelephora terrestris]|uniref:F-box domain-containing protein n=1 Tax=Thelephora terrestris TaxID=56493 RepID=A0A9P6L6E2_9AGAM|nr:hypothetical protein BJ322DRAFT_863274 [Thelephora terrestris]
MITPEQILELSVEQLIKALNKKLFMECAKVQAQVPPIYRDSLATVAVEIDILEKQAKAVLREVFTLKNALRPVNRLPPEVLACCATFVSPADPRPIVSLTHVCRYWRKVISFSPRNWASLATAWKRLVPLCLERAGAVPLAVDITVSNIKSGEYFLKTLLPNVPRIKSLRLTGYSSVEAIVDNLPGFFDSPMLNLVSLELQQSAAPVQPFPSDETPTPPVFRDIRTLKSLHLTQTPIYPALFHITSLVKLGLIGYTTPLDLGALIGFLDSNLALEFVDLDIRFTDGSVSETPVRTVSLSRLRHLSLTCSKEIDSRGLLSSIIFPRGVHLEVLLTKLGDIAKFNSFLPSSLKQIRELLHPISIVKTQFTPPMLQLSGNNSFLSLSAVGRQSSFYSGIGLFVTANVREFHVDIHPSPPTDNRLSWVLERLPALEILVFSKTVFPPGTLDILAAEPVLCPSLHTVAFFDCDLPVEMVKELGDVITKRYKTFAIQPHRVVLVYNTTTPPKLQAIQQLRKSVSCVEVRVDDKLPDLSR